MTRTRLTFILIVSILIMALHTFAENQPLLAPVGTYQVEEDDFVYARIGELELSAHSYRPKKEGVLPAAVEAHGGAWNLYDRMAGALYNKALASAGLYVLAVDFRQGPKYQHPLGSRDVAAAVRYLRSQSVKLGIHPDTIGLIGSSSGGHLALLAGIKPNADMHQGTTLLIDNKVVHKDQLDAHVRYIIALWPVSDPAYRYSYAMESGIDALVKLHDQYFGGIDAMKDAGIQRILDADEACSPLPAMLVVQPGEDKNVPQPMTFALLESLQKKNATIDYLFYPGMPHAFGHRPSPATDDLIQAMRDFVNRRLRK